MNDNDYWAVEAMLLYGGSFVRCLAHTARAADNDNLQRIKETWPEYWSKYTAMGQLLKTERGGAR